ncbi:MAG: PQQ-like beta-propeller repeat protein, partial [Planctomycetes bacterium]|nr:PQQ-like beta-propeller repeat protein [Planctomycetota bacterium]
MKQNFGPWSTAINTGNNPQLSTFWKRRLTMLSDISRTQKRLRRSDCLWLGVIGLALLLLPTVFAEEDVQAQNTGTTRPAEKQTGYVSNARLPKNPSVVWEFHSVKENGLKTIFPDLSDVTISDGVAYFGDGYGRLFARRADDGSAVWKHEHGHRIFRAPVVHGKTVYFTSRFGVAAVSRTTGTELWKYAIRPTGAVGANVVVAEDTLFVGGSDGHIHALDAKTGDVKWTKDIVPDAPDDPEG